MLVGEGLLVRRMLTVQDRAAIAKGMVGRMLAAADCGSDRVDRCPWYLERDTPQRREVWVSARVAADVNTPETPDPDQRPVKFDAASGLQGSGAGRS